MPFPSWCRVLTTAAFALAPLLAGCDLGPDYRRPALDVPATYRDATGGGTPSWPSGTWWQGFRSPALDQLEDEARLNSFDIAAAVARVRQADAQVRIAGAALLPSLSATGDATWQHEGIGAAGVSGAYARSNASFDLHDYAGGLSAGYELDFWGRNAAQKQSAIASAMYSRFDRQTVGLTVVSDVATTWFTALSYADRLAVARGNLASAEQTLMAIRGRFAVGTASALDVAQQQALTATERAVIPGFQSLLEQEIIALGILIGEPPERITVRPGTLTALDLPPVGPGMPSELLARRPDVASAEAQLVAQNFSIKVARAAFFPSVTLTASAGYNAAAINHLISPGSALMSAAAGLTAPIFDGGTLRGQLDLARGRYDELLADYRKAVVQAFSDVDTALVAFRYATQQEALQRIAVRTAQRAAAIARAQLDAGTVDITTVTTAETTLFSDQDTLVQDRLVRVNALVSLYKALGGGWMEPDRPVDAQFPGLRPGPLAGGVALPVGGNMK